MLICSLGYAVGQMMFGLAGTEPAMVGARLFSGAFLGGAVTAFLTYVVNTSPDEMRGSYLTMTATIQMVAGAFGFFVGGMLGEINVNLAVIVQVVTLASCGILFYMICEDDAATKLSDIKPKALFKQANPFAAFVASGKIMTPLLITIFAVCALSNLGTNAFDQSFNYYLKAQLALLPVITARSKR